MPRRIDTEAVINAVRLDEQAGDPAQPAAGFWLVYAKANGLYVIDDAGNITGPFSSGGDVATDAIWDAAGDIVQGTGPNAASRLAIGTAYQLPRVNSGATALEYASAGRVQLGVETPTGTTVTFSSIPAIFNSLEMEFVARTDKAAVAFEACNFYMNNDTTAGNYSRQQIFGTGTTATVNRADDPLAITVPAANATADYFGHGIIKINAYASTAFQKMARLLTMRREAAATQYIADVSLHWENTAAINRLDVVTSSAGNFIAGSVFRLYGVF